MTREEAIMCLYAVKTELMTRRMTFEGHESAPITAIDMAIEALSEEPPYQYSKAYVEQIRGERDILQDMVDNMAKPKTGWIPCSERLPSESGWYLITVQGCEKVADMEWYYGERDTWNGVSSEQQVIAWMPLPEPYKGGEDNDT